MKLDVNILNELEKWYADLKPLSLSQIVKNNPEKVAFISVDMINGFCKEGALSSHRIRSIIGRITDTLSMAHDKFNIKNFVAIQDRHEPYSTEFDAFPPHALADTKQADTISELKNIPFFDKFKVYYKNSLSTAYCDDFNKFMEQNPQIKTFIVLGNCTDFCVYSLALHIKLQANEKNLKRDVIVIEDMVQTYHNNGHNGDFYHLVFLHHMQMAANARVFKTIIE